MQTVQRKSFRSQEERLSQKKWYKEMQGELEFWSKWTGSPELLINTKNDRYKVWVSKKDRIKDGQAKNMCCSESPVWLLLTKACPVGGWSYSAYLGTLLSPANGVLQRCGLTPGLRVPSPLLLIEEVWSRTEGVSCTELRGSFLISVEESLKANKGTGYLTTCKYHL